MNTRTIFSLAAIFLSVNSASANYTAIGCENMEIKPVELHQAKEVKKMILECALDLWQIKSTYKELEQQFDAVGEFDDLIDIQTTYFDNNGIFLVLLDNQKVVGAGAIKKLNDEICELKRMWFFKEYRGKGFGSKMANQLLAFAKSQGYKKIRLDVYHPEVQTQAIALYRKLGFYEIDPYNNFPAKLFMEKVL